LRHLLRLISLRYLRASPTRTLLTVLGILLGVSVVFAIDVINNTVASSFRATIDKVAGKTALNVGSGTGVDEALLERVRAVPGVAAAAPMIEESVHELKSDTQLMVLGVDTVSDTQVREYEVTADDLQLKDDLAFLNDPHAVIVTTRFAERVGVKVGDTLSLETPNGKSEFTVRGTLAARGPATVFGGDLLLMDVFAAQIAFDRGKRFDHIDVVPDDGVEVATLKTRIEQAIAGAADVSRPERRSQETERLMLAFNLGLSMLGFVATFVGGFIVYNALAIAVAQRRREIGTWRALGATRRQIMLLFLGEGLVLGAVGGVAGLAFGMFLARSVLKLVSGAISALYLNIKPDQLTVLPSSIVSALLLGLIAALIAAFFPARRASSVEPVTAMRKDSAGADAALATGKTSIKIACAALVATVSMAVAAHVYQNYLLGYAVSGMGALAVGFISPTLTLWVGNLARRLAPGAPPAMLLGIVSFVRSAGRNSVIVAAFGIGLANVVNTATFVGSMKYSVERWFDRSARADMVVFIGHKVQANIDSPMPESVGEELSQLHGVEFVDPFRMVRQTYDARPFKVVSRELERYLHYNELQVVAGDLQRALPRIQAGTGLAASEAFVREFGLGLGDKVTLQTGVGPSTFEIVLVCMDYNTDLGILSTTREVYKRLWRDTLVDTYSLYLAPGTDSDDVRSQITADLSKRYRLLVLNNAQYRAGVMSFIDGSFALMRSTEIVAIIVAILGIINTLLVSVMDRRREIGVLKAVGADQKQVQQMILTEATLIGLASSIIGICFGALFSAYIVRELLRFQVGWQMSWHLSPWVILEALLLGQVVTALAAWFPVRSASRVAAAEALQYE
jgi:putative ABC transport system permease protein